MSLLDFVLHGVEGFRVFSVAVRQPDAELPTSLGKEAEPRIILRGRDASKDAASVETKDSEEDTSAVVKEAEELAIDPAAYDAMTPTQKKMFDLRLKLVSWMILISRWSFSVTNIRTFVE